MKRIGLVGGISWVSTMDYYKFINVGINERLGGLNFAELVMYSLDFGRVYFEGWENAYELLLGACESLKRSKVDAIVLCANTAHLFADRLQQAVELPFIHIGTETAKAVEQRGLKKVGLLGTKYTMEMAFYRDKLEQQGLITIVPEEQATRNYIQYILQEELGRGIISMEAKANFASIVEDLVERGAEGIILGCTEIPMLVSQASYSIPVFDTTRIHSNAAVEFALRE